jgi:uncharacterized protein (DUF934 family)
MVLVKNGQVASDYWQHIEDTDPLPQAGAVTISWARWLSERDSITRGPSELGVRLPNTIAADDVGADAGRFGLITVTYPNIGDGRAYSQARILRSRAAFKGEIRAIGSVVRDQLQFMQRCGIDAFELPEKALTEDWLAALSEFDLFYQPAEDSRPWIARQRHGRN